VGIFTFSYCGALTIFGLNGVENRIAPTQAVIPDILMGVSGRLSTSTSDELLRGRRPLWDAGGVRARCRVLREEDSGCAHGPNGT